MTDPKPMTTDHRPPIKVLVVDDSPVAREFLVHILSSDPEIQVVGTANNGEEAIEAVVRSRPDVITMDIHMPKMDGSEATRRIMEVQPTPIVIVTSSAYPKEVSQSLYAIEIGALAVLPRPMGIGDPAYETTARELVQTVKLMSEIKLVRRFPRKQISPPVASVLKTKETLAEVQVIAIGGSTGAPLVIKTILSGLPKELPVPVLIVQHISSGFIFGFVDWLTTICTLPIHIAFNNESLLPGHVYLSPDGSHMGVKSKERIEINERPPENGLRPSVSYLFRSVVQVFGNNAAGVLLTGMGKDGAEELKLMRDKGALTIAQDEKSSVVFGMPGEAIKLGAATYVLSPERIADALISVTNSSRGGVRQ